MVRPVMARPSPEVLHQHQVAADGLPPPRRYGDFPTRICILASRPHSIVHPMASVEAVPLLLSLLRDSCRPEGDDAEPSTPGVSAVYRMVLVDDSIRIRGARVHNLKNISLELPHNRLTVVTGVSGRSEERRVGKECR